MKKREDIIYLKADKGSSPVLLDKDFYRDKVLQKLNTPTYTKLQRNMDYAVNLKLQCFVKKYSTHFTPNEKRAILNFDYRTTNIYAPPKIHKSKLISDKLEEVTGEIL